MSEWNLADTTLGLAEREPYQVAVLPFGATEAHGRHLPYATDTIQCEEIARRACQVASERGAQVLLLPAMPYGVNENNLGFKWTMSVRPSTLLRFLGDIVSCVEHHGIPKMVVLNGHGGNEFQPHLRELCRQTSVKLMLVNWYSAAGDAYGRIFTRPGEHGDEMETSLIMYLRPELVRMELAGEGAVREPVLTAMREGWAWIARPWERFTLDSGVGNPALATAQKGEQFVEAVVARLAEFLVELSAAPLDDLYPYR